jgi:hypothetical protein
VLGAFVEDGIFDEATAHEVGVMVLKDNARKLYKVDLDND